MKIFITGISGFVARHFLHLLSTMDESFQVAGVYNRNKPDFSEDDFENIDCRFIKLNLLDKKALAKELDLFRPDYIVQLASRSSVAYSWQNPGELIAENTQIFINVVECMRELSLSCRLLSVGSAEEYGHVESDELPLKELACSKPVSPYGAARVLQNNLVSIYSKNFGLDIIHTRSFNHIGPFQNENFVIGSFLKQISEQLVQGKSVLTLTVGDIEVIRDFTDVRDVVRAYFLLLHHGKKGETYNVCSNKRYCLKDLIEMFAGITGTTIQCKTEKNNFRPTENKELVGCYAKLKEATGWQPLIPIEQSLNDLLQYWKAKLAMAS